MNSHSQQPININLGQNENINDKINSYSEFKDYIIKNNIILQNENNNSRVKIKELESIILQQENEEDKYDNRVRYMKGLINNLNEINNKYDSLNKKIENINNIINDYNDELYKKIKIFIMKYFLCILSLILSDFILDIISYNIILYNYIYLIKYSTNSIIYSILIKILIKNNNWYKINTKSSYLFINTDIKNIRELKVELKNLKESTLSLDNWICEI